MFQFLPQGSNTSSNELDLRNNDKLITNSSHSLPQTIKTKSRLTDNSLSNVYGSGSSKQGNSSRITTTKRSTVTSESDDDTSCQEVAIPDEIIFISDSEDSVDNNVRNEITDNAKNYCSICKKEKILDHDCSKFNKEFATCLVPNCNILARSSRDFTPHYRQHIGIPYGATLCRHCYQENKKTERDANGNHICRSGNVFKCYACNIKFKSMAEFAYHKHKTHNGRLINSTGNYLCFYCEKSSPNLLKINDHIKCCIENKIQKVQVDVTEDIIEEPETKSFMAKQKNVIKHKSYTKEKSKRSSDYMLYTCLKPSCNLIFQSFAVFKFHHREHFEVGNKLMCWQCCSPFSNLNYLRAHQMKHNCRIPGMFKCFDCSECFDDLQSLSIHKYTIHNGELICKNKKNILCSFCNSTSNFNDFKNHLIQCCSNKIEIKKKILPKSRFMSKVRSSFKCLTCGKICSTKSALLAHVKVHNPSTSKRVIKVKMTNTPMKMIDHKLANTSDDKILDINPTLSSTSNKKKESSLTDYNMFPFENNFYFCIKCPKKFTKKKGLIKHWTYCSNESYKPKSISALNYYCTKCKEYYSRVSFGEHWKVNHGKRLPYNKSRRYFCSKCPSQFMYKIALTMHEEHVHSMLETSVNISNVTPVECVVMLPLMSDPLSVAKNYAKECLKTNEDNCDNIVQNMEHEKITNIPLNTAIDQCETIIVEVVDIKTEKPDNDLENDGIPNLSNNNYNNADVHSGNHNVEKSNDHEMIVEETFNNDANTMLVNNNPNEINENIVAEDVTTVDDNKVENMIITLRKEENQENQNNASGIVDENSENDNCETWIEDDNQSRNEIPNSTHKLPNASETNNEFSSTVVKENNENGDTEMWIEHDNPSVIEIPNPTTKLPEAKEENRQVVETDDNCLVMDTSPINNIT